MCEKLISWREFSHPSDMKQFVKWWWVEIEARSIGTSLVLMEIKSRLMLWGTKYYAMKRMSYCRVDVLQEWSSN